MGDQKENKRYKVSQQKLSDFERLHIVESFSEEVRNDGRTTKQFRPICLEINVLPQLDGSARISAGDVDVTVGVRGELETIIDPDTYFADNPKPLRIDFNVEFSANTDQRFLGKEPMDVAELIRTALNGAYSNDEALPTLKRLQLTPRLSWNLFVDVEIHGYDGNVIDYAGIALKAALTEFKIPKMNVLSDMPDSIGAEIEGVEMPNDVEFVRLDTSRCPLLITVNLVNDSFAVDITEAESSCVTSAICVAAIINDEKGKRIPNDDDCLITYSATFHRGTMELSTLREAYKFAVATLKQLDSNLEEFWPSLEANSKSGNS